MAITAENIIKRLGSEPWSGFNRDDMEWGSEDAESAKAVVNRALRYLLNLHDFPFRAKEKTIETTAGAEVFTSVEGQITSIYDPVTLEPLEFIGDSTKYSSEQTGKPSGYWVEYNNPKAKIRLYPIPDGIYNYNVAYNAFQPVIDSDGKTKKYEFENANDFINMPANLEYLFVDCLVMRAIVTNMKDEQDENYRPSINEFNEHWRLFKKSCKPKKIINRVVW
jgi:hypothetical protein